jgi:hypothetical protein
MNAEEDVKLRSRILRKDSQITVENLTTLQTDSDKEYNVEILHPNYLFHNKIHKKISSCDFYTRRILPKESKTMKH